MPAVPSGDLLTLTEATSNSGFFAPGVCAGETMTEASMISDNALPFMDYLLAEGFGRRQTRRRNRDPSAFGHALQHPVAPCLRAIEIGRFIKAVDIRCSDRACKVRRFGD